MNSPNNITFHRYIHTHTRMHPSWWSYVHTVLLPVFKSEVLQVKVHLSDERWRFVSLHSLLSQTQKLSHLNRHNHSRGTSLRWSDLCEAVECRRSDEMVQESSLQGHRTLIGLGKHKKETL